MFIAFLQFHEPIHSGQKVEQLTPNQMFHIITQGPCKPPQ